MRKEIYLPILEIAAGGNYDAFRTGVHRPGNTHNKPPDNNPEPNFQQSPQEIKNVLNI